MTASDLSSRRSLPFSFRKTLLAPSLILALAVAGAPVHEARAQGAPAASQGDKTAAEALFGEGKRLMNEGKYAEACPKLAESQRIDPGAGTLTALALCHRGEGKIATAWSEFKEVISLARKDGRKDREEVATANANELEPKLSRLKINLDPAAEQQNLVVKIDDTVVNKAAFGSALPVDPGSRKITATAPLKKTFETTIQIGAEKDEKAVVIHALEDDPEAIAAAEREKEEAARRAAEAQNPGRDGSSQRLVGYILGGVGLAAIGVGSYFGVQALGKNSDSDTLCPSSPCANAEGVKASEDAKSNATISNIAIGGGILALAGGVVLVLTAPRARTTGFFAPPTRTAGKFNITPSTDGRSSSVAISGTF